MVCDAGRLIPGVASVAVIDAHVTVTGEAGVVLGCGRVSQIVKALRSPGDLLPCLPVGSTVIFLNVRVSTTSIVRMDVQVLRSSW